MRLSSDEELTTAAQFQQRPRRFAWTTTTSWTFHLLALIVYTILFLQYQPPLALCNSHNPLQPREIPSAEDVASYETVEFAPFSFGYNHKQNAYTGPPTPESDAAWHRLWEVGVYSMTDEEYELWGGATVQVRDKPDQHIVVIEMLHQLHCVSMLRDIIYSPERKGNPYNESQWWRDGHIDHCLDYLRSVITCHGDLTPMPMVYNPMGHPRYAPQFSIIRSCRSFDNIYDFAAKGNRSGTQLDHEDGDPVQHIG